MAKINWHNVDVAENAGEKLSDKVGVNIQRQLLLKNVLGCSKSSVLAKSRMKIRSCSKRSHGPTLNIFENVQTVTINFVGEEHPKLLQKVGPRKVQVESGKQAIIKAGANDVEHGLLSLRHCRGREDVSTFKGCLKNITNRKRHTSKSNMVRVGREVHGE